MTLLATRLRYQLDNRWLARDGQFLRHLDHRLRFRASRFRHRLASPVVRLLKQPVVALAALLRNVVVGLMVGQAPEHARVAGPARVGQVAARVDRVVREAPEVQEVRPVVAQVAVAVVPVATDGLLVVRVVAAVTAMNCSRCRRRAIRRPMHPRQPARS